MSLLLDLGPYSGFIWAAYAVFFITLTCLAAWIMTDEQRQRRLLAELEAQGVRRRSAQTMQGAAPPAPKPPPRGSASRKSPAGSPAAHKARPRRPGAPPAPMDKP